MNAVILPRFVVDGDKCPKTLQTDARFAESKPWFISGTGMELVELREPWPGSRVMAEGLVLDASVAYRSIGPAI
jgi:hypothetical protein